MDSYEKKYKEALERARKLKENPKAIFFEEKNVNVSDYIFPELKESEDEMIRKSLISYLHGLGEFEYPDKKTYNNWLIWLEKQGEQEDFAPKDYSSIDPHFFKAANNVEPKFKVGDWITNGDYTWKIIEIKPWDYILRSQDGNVVADTISYVDEQFHLMKAKVEPKFKVGD